MARPRKSEIQIQDHMLKDLLSALCINMKVIREKRNMTQQDLAYKSKLSLSTITAIEQRSLQNLNLSTLTAICKALRISPTVLLNKKLKNI
ncbi:MAG: helix-turn-helix transcriptional regulator [Bdellovibrionales bacterium]|nr:helix-turn-helix transcriptional regulator [Bdellovibrionales bacterium]